MLGITGLLVGVNLAAEPLAVIGTLRPETFTPGVVHEVGAVLPQWAEARRYEGRLDLPVFFLPSVIWQVPEYFPECSAAAASEAATNQGPGLAGDPFEVPEGSASELVEYIGRLRQLKPPEPFDPDQLPQFQRKKAEALLKAAEKLLAQKPKEAQWNEAAQAKLEALGLLALSGDSAAEKQLDAYVKNLQTLRKRELARYGRAVLLAVRVQQTKTPQEIKKWFQQFVQFLSQGPLGPRELELMDTLPQLLERENPAVAVEIYRQLVFATAKSPDPLAASFAKKWEEKGRRLELLTKPIQIVGFTLDGREFQWERFRQGKIVLVDFWATWCGWCVREIPELMQLYQKYRSRGFEIVGISADRTRRDLEEFLTKNPIPWPIVYGRNGPSPTLEYYGIHAFPTMWLVGKDGKVISFNARGENLRRELERLFGPAEQKTARGLPSSTPLERN
ncbi:MAG: TlpA family protein disulfide reductase [Thermoguttaceae bacterium]|nr:TlpA family protein disulfide reductase [Thermoguttaceae bacterium]MDW8039279.1 TlpA disulfide reductase family protein [Thermoguttaceae bacterium]